MKIQYHNAIHKNISVMKLSCSIFLLWLNIALLMLLSCKSKNETPLKLIDSNESTINRTEFGKVVCSIIGDVPYNAAQRDGLNAMIQTHNAKA